MCCQLSPMYRRTFFGPCCRNFCPHIWPPLYKFCLLPSFLTLPSLAPCFSCSSRGPSPPSPHSQACYYSLLLPPCNRHIVHRRGGGSKATLSCLALSGHPSPPVRMVSSGERELCLLLPATLISYSFPGGGQWGRQPIGGVIPLA